MKRYKYNGKECDDETGLDYYGARYYASWLCRFISVDPQKDNYPMQNSFAYADNNPITLMDINGEGTEGVEGGDHEYRNENGDKQVSYRTYSGIEAISSGQGGIREITPSGDPISEGMSETELFQFATARVLMPGIHLVSDNQYVDQKLLNAEGLVRDFFSSNIPGYASDSPRQSELNSQVYENTINALFGEDANLQTQAVNLINKADDFLWNFTFSDVAELIIPSGLTLKISRGIYKKVSQQILKLSLKNVIRVPYKVSLDEAIKIGKEFVGKNYNTITRNRVDGTKYISAYESADGTRLFRLPVKKMKTNSETGLLEPTGKFDANFQIRKDINVSWKNCAARKRGDITNTHLGIKIN